MSMRDPGMTRSIVAQMVAAGSPQMIINQPVTEGQTVTLPTTNQDLVLNLQMIGVSLDTVHVALPGNTDGRVGQRVFVNSNGHIGLATFTSAITVNNADYLFNPGDNCVFFRNAPTIFSRLTS